MVRAGGQKPLGLFLARVDGDVQLVVTAGQWRMGVRFDTRASPIHDCLPARTQLRVQSVRLPVELSFAIRRKQSQVRSCNAKKPIRAANPLVHRVFLGANR